MENKIDQVFKSVRDLNPPKKLAGAILNRIELEKNKAIQRKLFLDRIGIAGSILFLLGTLFPLGKIILESEFWQLASLIFSDLEIIVQNWSQFIYSLLETLPIVQIVGILIPVFFFSLFFNSYRSLINRNHQKHA
jgi:hypothetical protein